MGLIIFFLRQVIRKSVMFSDLNYEYLLHFKKNSVALRLLSSPHFALLSSFFFNAFIKKNRRSVPYQELIAQLDYQLQDIKDSYGEEVYPKSAKAYIDDWINNKLGYLRKYMPLKSDEPDCDLLPEVEKAIRWLQELQGKQFVGTESRLKLVIDLIADLVRGTSQDSDAKLMALRAQKKEIEQQIVAVEQGMDIGYNDTQIRERIFLVSDMSRQLLGEFRQVEANFRSLDRVTRKTITSSDLQKGSVLDEVISGQDVIDNSDEGSSFSAFFELLMSAGMREHLRRDLKELLNLDETKAFAVNDELLVHLYSYLLDAGNKVNKTKQQITEHLSRYIQEQSQDNRRIIELIRAFEKNSSTFEKLPSDLSFYLDDYSLKVNPSMSRQLFQIKEKEQLDSQLDEAETDPAVDLSALFDVSRIDEQQLLHNINKRLYQQQGQVTLAQVVDQFPIKQGLDEVLTYLKIASEQQVNAHIDDSAKETINLQESLGTQRQLSIPLVTFIREPNA